MFLEVQSIHKTEDEMVGWHHQLSGHESEQAPGVGDGQGSLVCRSPWGRQESDRTEWLSWSTGQDSVRKANGPGEAAQPRGPHHRDLISCPQRGPCPACSRDWRLLRAANCWSSFSSHPPLPDFFFFKYKATFIFSFHQEICFFFFYAFGSFPFFFFPT